MGDLRELLATRGTQGDTLALRALREGLAADPATSGAAAELHALLQRYFTLDDAASAHSFTHAFRRAPDTARALIAIVAEEGEDKVAALMRSLAEGQPRPLGALRDALTAVAATHAQSAGPGVQAGFAAFAAAALQSKGSTAEMELSLVWSAVESALLDRVERCADALAFAHGPTHRAAIARMQKLDALVSSRSIDAMLTAMATAQHPRVLARPSAYDIAHEAAPAAMVEVPVRHHWHHDPLGPAARLVDGPATAQLKALYAFTNGADLFIPLEHVPHEPGLTLIPDHAWDQERTQMMVWLTMGVDAADLPAWAHTLVPLAALTGDASRWVVPIEGPYAGAVLLSADDVHEGRTRYPSVAHFIAALQVCTADVLGNGGYVSYVAPDHAASLYPEGFLAD